MVEVENLWLSRLGCCWGSDWEEWEDMIGVGCLRAGFLYWLVVVQTLLITPGHGDLSRQPMSHGLVGIPSSRQDIASSSNGQKPSL